MHRTLLRKNAQHAGSSASASVGATTSTGNIIVSSNSSNVCLRCRFLSGIGFGNGSGQWSVNANMGTIKPAFSWPDYVDRRANSTSSLRQQKRWINTSARGLAQAFAHEISSGPGSSVSATTTTSSVISSSYAQDKLATQAVTYSGLKRNGNWDEGWFEGNQKALGGSEGKEVEQSQQETCATLTTSRWGPYRGSAVKRVREAREIRMSTGGGGRGELKMDHHGRESESGGGGSTQEVKMGEREGNEEGEGEQRYPETTIKKTLHRDHEPPDERTVNIGKTIRTLQSKLPTLLSSPTSLQNSLLSPNITLHLFPSSHPHLPTARGRVAYKTALWTSPFVWGQLPGRVRLEILAARVVKLCERGEELRVRWRTVPSSSSSSSTQTHIASSSPSQTPSQAHQTPFSTETNHNDYEKDSPAGGFTGLFIFTFDEKGRILSHTIEHADEGWNRGEEDIGYSFLGVAEWLLKKAKQAGEGAVGKNRGEPGLVFVRGDERSARGVPGRGVGRGKGREAEGVER